MLALGAGWALSEGLSWGARPAGRGHRPGGARVAALSAVLPGLPIAARRHLAEPALPSRFSQFLLMFGTFLVMAAFFLALISRELGPPPLRGFLVALPWALLIPLLILALSVFSLAVLPQGKAFVQEVLNNPAVQANVGNRTLGGLIALMARLRLPTPWTWLVLAG